MLAVVEFTDVISMLCAAGVVALVYGLRRLNERLRRVERILDAALSHMGVDGDELPSRELSRPVRALADSRERQLAIELHQRESGLEFEDAQVAVEAYMRGELTGDASSVSQPVRRLA